MSIIPAVIGTAIYIELTSPKLQHRLINAIPPIYVKPIAAIHNSLLAGFSLFAFLYLSSSIFINYGVAFHNRHFFQHTDIQKIMMWVYYSKIYEYMDTVLLYLKNKRPIFLQKFRHIGAVTIWYLSYTYQCDYIVYVSWLNTGVHTLTYSYYLVSIFNKNIPEFVKRTIVASQIIQLIAGMIFLPFAYFNTEVFSSCNVMQLFILYICYYSLKLFIDFPLKTYSNIQRL